MPFRPKKPLWPYVLNKDCDLADGLVGWWPGDPPGGNKTLDLSGKGNHLTLNGTVPATGLWGAALEGGKSAFVCDGSTNYAEASAVPVAGVPITLSCWFKPASVAVAVGLVGEFVAGNVTGFEIRQQTTDVRINSILSSSFGTATTTVGSLAAGTWAHACGVVLSATSRTAYLNGANAVTNTTSITPTGMDRTTIGARASNSGHSAFANGSVFDACIWNRALTAAEVYSLWNPATRWQLRYQIGRKTWLFGAAAASTFVPSGPTPNLPPSILAM